MLTCTEIEAKLAEAKRLIPAKGVGSDMRAILADVLGMRSGNPIQDLHMVAGGLTGFEWCGWGKNAKKLVMKAIEAY